MIRFMIHIIFSCLLDAVSEMRLNQKSNIGTFSYNSVILLYLKYHIERKAHGKSNQTVNQI